jgi:hypothetical protein
MPVADHADKAQRIISTSGRKIKLGAFSEARPAAAAVPEPPAPKAAVESPTKRPASATSLSDDSKPRKIKLGGFAAPAVVPPAYPPARFAREETPIASAGVATLDPPAAESPPVAESLPPASWEPASDVAEDWSDPAPCEQSYQEPADSECVGADTYEASASDVEASSPYEPVDDASEEPAYDSDPGDVYDEESQPVDPEPAQEYYEGPIAEYQEPPSGPPGIDLSHYSLAEQEAIRHRFDLQEKIRRRVYGDP